MFAFVLATEAFAIPCHAQSSGQLGCESAARAAYGTCLAHGSPLCAPSEPNCTHTGTAAQCSALVGRLNANCQPSFAWTQVGGNAPGFPPGRYFSANWLDPSGNFWLFGGQNNLGANGDMWKYTPNSAGQGAGSWTPIPASAVWPGIRTNATFATDPKGHFWLFGGQGGSGPLNGLWEYTVGTGPGTGWVRESANDIANQPESGTAPGGRTDGSSWIDASGRFWLFGGLVYVSRSSQPPLNDLWTFTPKSGGGGSWAPVPGGRSKP